MKNIRVLDSSKLVWPFAKCEPYVKTEVPDCDYQESLYVDPFPCYSHHPTYCQELIDDIKEKVGQPNFEPICHILGYEELSRTNGHAAKMDVWNEETGRHSDIRYYIVLSGKRICIHPAVTRYLVGHESGHLVDSLICYKNKIKFDETTEFDKQYAKVRGIELNNEYGALKWHTNIGEIIANDIRIVLFGLEPEFWPHLCNHPLENNKVRDFWLDLKKRDFILKFCQPK